MNVSISAKYPLKTLIKFKHDRDNYIGQIISAEIAPNNHIARKPGTIIYLIRVLKMNNTKLNDDLVTTIAEDEILEAKIP